MSLPIVESEPFDLTSFWKSAGTKMFWCVVLLALVYSPVLFRMGQDWYNDDDMGHGFFVPLAACYFAWLSRERIWRDRAFYRPHWGGLVLLGWGALQLMIGTLGVEFFLARTAFLLSLTGVILWMGGLRLLKNLAFPLVLLIFMIPLPAIVYNEITFPLQLLASRVAEFFLGLIGIPVFREGNILELPSQKLSVVEACSGIRSLLSLSFLALVYGALFSSKPWMRWFLLLITTIIAVASNAVRVTVTGILSEYNPALAQGWFHEAEGFLSFGVALLLLVFAHRLIDYLWARSHPESGTHA